MSRSELYPSSRPPSFPIGCYGKRCRSTVAVITHAGLAIARRHVPPRQRQNRAQGRFRDRREMIAHQHQRYDPGHVGGGHVQYVGILELAQHFHFLLQVPATGDRQALVDIRFQGRLVQRRV